MSQPWDISIAAPSGGPVRLAGVATGEPAGGSQPIERTFTAAEIAAAYDVGDDVAAVEWPELVGAFLYGVFESDVLGGVPSGLDSGDFDQLYVYSPGASTDDVWQNGVTIPRVGVSTGADVLVTFTVPGQGSPDAAFAYAIVDDAMGYAVFGGFSGTPPTTGEIRLRAIPWPS